MRKQGFDKSLIFLGFIIVFLIGSAIFLLTRVKSDSVSESIQEGAPIITAFLIHDQGKLLLTEVLVYHPVTNKAALFDVPGETGTLINNKDRIDRIDFLYDYQNPAEYLKKISSLLKLPVENYIQMDLAGFEKSIDFLSGITVFIPDPMDLYSGDRRILLPSGNVLLDGRSGVDYLCLKNDDESEIEKISRRQKLVQAFLQAFGEEGSIFSSPELGNFIGEQFQSSYEDIALFSLISAVAQINTDSIVNQRVLGAYRNVQGSDVSGEVDFDDESLLLFPHYSGRLLEETVEQTMVSLESLESSSNDDLTVKVEILNGTDTNGLAGRTANLLQNFGFRVVRVDNADLQDYEQTTVISRLADDEKANKVAEIINCNEIHIEPVDPYSLESGVDVTLILGKDFDGKTCKN